MEQFLLFIVIGIISLVLNRKKVQPKQESRPVQRHSTMEQKQTNRESRRDINSEPVERPSFPIDDLKEAKHIQEVAEILLTKAQPKLETKIAEAEVQMEALMKDAEHYRAKAKSIRKEATSPNVLAKEGEPPFQPNDILKGIVMAEVLGPPRAKKPYRR